MFVRYRARVIKGPPSLHNQTHTPHTLMSILTSFSNLPMLAAIASAPGIERKVTAARQNRRAMPCSTWISHPSILRSTWCRKSETEFYTSDDIREFTDLGYTYPEFMEELAEREARVRASISVPVPGPGVALGAGLWPGVGAKVARFLKGAEKSEEPWEHKHHIFEKSIWCPHSKLPWCGYHGRKDHEAPD